jgi:hypothetical protein
MKTLYNTMRTHAEFDITKVLPEAVFLVDNDQGMSVTNDAEAVVEEVLSQYPVRRIFYRDTQGEWDELRHDGTQFMSFGSLTNNERAKYKEFLT